jgi:hypothetical protein
MPGTSCCMSGTSCCGPSFCPVSTDHALSVLTQQIARPMDKHDFIIFYYFYKFWNLKKNWNFLTLIIWHFHYPAFQKCPEKEDNKWQIICQEKKTTNDKLFAKRRRQQMTKCLLEKKGEVDDVFWCPLKQKEKGRKRQSSKAKKTPKRKRSNTLRASLWQKEGLKFYFSNFGLSV